MEGLPKELQNHVKFTDELNNEFAPDDNEKNQIDLETLNSLSDGEGFVIGDMIIPPPTTGVLVLLEAINSPFVSTNPSDMNKVDLMDIYKALYVLVHREQAVSPIMIQKQFEVKSEAAFERTEKSPEHLAIFLAHTQRHNNSAFDSEVLRWSTELGNFNPKEAVDTIGDYLNMCMGGFQLLPKSDNIEKKN